MFEMEKTKQVPMVEEEAAEGVPEVLPRVRRLAETDREAMEKGTSAFVSYVRGYREHQVDRPRSKHHCITVTLAALLTYGVARFFGNPLVICKPMLQILCQLCRPLW